MERKPTTIRIKVSMDGQEAIENEGQVDDDIVENDTINITEWDAVRLESDESFIKEAVNIPNPNALSDVKDESSSHGRRKRSRSASMGSSASETDSGSYWSCISDEDEKLDDNDIFGFEDSETKFTNSVDVPFLDEKNQNLGQEYDIIPIVSDDNGNDRAIKHSERWHEVDEPIQPVEEDEVCSSRIDASATYQNASSSENGKTEHSTETDTTLATIEEQEDGSTFKKFHSRISGKLQDKLKYHEHVSKFRSISVIEGIYHKQLDQKLEKCLSAYDIIDKFDVKVSEKEAGFTKSDSFNPLRSLSLSLKRTFSTRRSFRSNKSNQVIIAPVSASKDQQPDQNVTQKYGTWPRRKTELQSEKGKLDVSFSVLTTEDGDTVQVISVSPQVQTKKSSGTTGSTESNDISQTNDNYGNDETDAGFPSVNSDNETQGIDSEETDNAEVHRTKVTPVVRVENNHDVFENEQDNVEPIPPPRRRRAKVSDSGIKAVTNVTEKKPRRVTLGAFGSNNDVPKGTKVDDNLLKGLIPFLDSESKRKTWPGASASKSVAPNLEHVKLFTDSFPVTFVDFPQDRRSLIALEIYTTERSYVRGLEVIVKLFKRRLRLGDFLDAKEAETVFSNVDEILDFNGELLEILHSRINKWSDEQRIGDIFLQDLPNDPHDLKVIQTSRWKIYATYCQNYDASEACLKQKMKKKKEFCNLLNMCYSNPACQPGLTLPSYLITSVQRIPRYILLLKDLIRKTPASHPDLKDLSEALRVMEKVAAYINDQLKQSQSEAALAALQSQIIGLKAYYIPGRTLIHEGPVCLSNIKKTYQCVLFNDLLVFAVKGSNRQSEVELVLDLSTVWFEDLKDLDPQTTKEDAIALYTPDRPYSIYVGTNGEKKLWLQHLGKTILLHLGYEESKKIDLSRRSASHTFKDGAVYSGDFIESKRHGEGTMMWPNQMTYRGQWFDNERNGQGVLEYGTGEIYEGEWKDDKLYGYGKLKYNNGDEFLGEWKLGIRHGEGTILFENGDVFEGHFANDVIEGQGKLTCKNGMEYSGTWKRNMKHGFGTLKFSNSDEYKGEFKFDRFHGNGEITYTSGAIYKGDFENGERHGNGTLTEMNGIVYEGDWMHDCKEGKGKLTYPNGDVYEGSFIQGKKFGNGKMMYNNGNCYNGQWENDLISGTGTMTYRDGGHYEGVWKVGTRHGMGKMKYWNGSVYDGNWQYDLPHGSGTLTKTSGWKYKGYWSLGKQHGQGTLSDQINCYKFQGVWKNGIKEGKGIEMAQGFLYEGDFRYDKRHGNGIETAPDTTTYEGYWKRGQKHGKGIRRLPNGMVQVQVWMTGCLMECPAVVARELPALERN